MKLKRDILRTYDLSTGNTLRRIIQCYRTPGVHAVAIFRFGNWLLGKPLIVRLLLRPCYEYLDHRIRLRWGIQIQRKATIGEGFYIGHYGGIFVADGATIGRNVNISHDVTIGLAGEGARRGCPVIGDNVYIGPGAKINGRIRIGHNVKIGPNAVVTHDIPDNSLVHIRPMQVVSFPSQYGKNPG